MDLIIDRSAPPENVLLPDVNTTPLTAASATVASTMASNSSSTWAVKTFMDFSGISQVTRAMPSASVSTVKLV